MNLYFTSEICDSLDLLGTPMALNTCLSQICKDGVQIQLEIQKISRCGPRSVDDAGLHVVVMLRTAWKCTKKYNARAQLLFC